jgi:2-oxoglutarate ferredoxin oxidoreductase subunit alpha
MAALDMVIEICGGAGEGTISAGEIFTRFMSDQGFDIISFDSYPSEIRGFGKCVAHFRISSQKALSPGKHADVLVALNDAHSLSQLDTLKENGIVIFDSKPPRYHEEDQSVAGWLRPGMLPYGIPLHELAHKAAGSARGRNMVALGAMAWLFDVDAAKLGDFIRARYAKKSQKIIDANLKSFTLGYEWTREHRTKAQGYSFQDVVLDKSSTDKLILSGNQAVARGAVDSGLHLYAGYPITPATKIMEILSKELPLRGGVMIQTEDEISAIGHVIGAGYAGKRAMTATSGPGFCLMTELCNLAVMAEVPAVVVDSQRGGPSTGLPTKTEQSDLEIAVFGGSGDSPRVVIAPTSIANCYQGVCQALYIAEKYQTLSVLLLDFYLSNSISNIPAPTPPGKEMLDANIVPQADELKPYVRFKPTQSGISPRTLPGMQGGMYVTTGLEHDELGRPVYDPKSHTTGSSKRYRKMETLAEELPTPFWLGDKEKIEIGVIAWGSTVGSATEAVLKARKEGLRAAIFYSDFIAPYPVEELKKFSAACDKLLVPELNYTGQFANYLAPHLNREVGRLNMVTGLPMYAEDILVKMQQIAAATETN